MSKLLTASIASVFLLSGCVHHSKPTHEERTSYEDVVKKVRVDSSFGFSLQGHDYYFVARRDDDSCGYFDGYKDGRLSYVVPWNHENYTKLAGIYGENRDPQLKAQSALAYIERASNLSYVCPPKKKESKSASEVAGDALGFVIYGTMAVFVSPIAVPAILADNDSVNDLLAKLRQIRLGNSYEQVQKIMADPDGMVPKVEEELYRGHVVQSFSYFRSLSNPRRTVFVFKDKKLVAYVWGLVAEQ